MHTDTIEAVQGGKSPEKLTGPKREGSSKDRLNQAPFFLGKNMFVLGSVDSGQCLDHDQPAKVTEQMVLLFLGKGSHPPKSPDHAGLGIVAIYTEGGIQWRKMSRVVKQIIRGEKQWVGRVFCKINVFFFSRFQCHILDDRSFPKEQKDFCSTYLHEMQFLPKGRNQGPSVSQLTLP